MSDLVAFANARLDEEEAIAKQAGGDDDCRWQYDPRRGYEEWPGSVRDVPTGTTVASCDSAEGAHIARHDPARVLREVRFKRALLAMHRPVPFWGNNPPPLKDRTPENARAWYCECQCPDGVIEGTYPCDTAKLIVSVWDEHTDFDQEWKQ